MTTNISSEVLMDIIILPIMTLLYIFTCRTEGYDDYGKFRKIIAVTACDCFLVTLMCGNLLIVMDNIQNLSIVFLSGAMLFGVSVFLAYYYVKGIPEAQREKKLKERKTSKDKFERIEYYRWVFHRGAGYIGAATMLSIIIMQFSKIVGK